MLRGISDERQKEDVVAILKEFFAMRYRRTREVHVCKFLLVDHAGALLECRIGFGIAALSPLPQRACNVLLLFCIVTTAGQVHTDFHGAQHPLHRPCVSSKGAGRMMVQ
jgi:hypothetical protein